MRNYIKILTFLFVFVGLCLIRTSAFVAIVDHSVYSLALQLSYSKTWLLIWYGVTQLGEWFFVYVVLAILSILVLMQHRNRYGFGFVLLMIGLSISNVLFKVQFHLPRPVGLATFYEELSTYSFPSGHAVNSILVFFLIPRLYQFIQQGQIAESQSIRERSTSFALMLFGAIMIGLSRIFLGVHWFSDVVAGMVWGAVFYQIILEYLRMLTRRKNA